MTDERTSPSAPVRTGPADPLHDAAHNVVKGILGNVLHPATRKQLGDALSAPLPQGNTTGATHKAPAEGWLGGKRNA